MLIISLGNWIELESTPQIQAVHTLEYGALNWPVIVHEPPEKYNNNSHFAESCTVDEKIGTSVFIDAYLLKLRSQFILNSSVLEECCAWPVLLMVFIVSWLAQKRFTYGRWEMNFITNRPCLKLFYVLHRTLFYECCRAVAGYSKLPFIQWIPEVNRS